MNRWVRALFPPDAEVASPPLVFMSVSLVMALQILVYLVIGTGLVSLGLMINEILFMAGIPIILISFLGYDSKKLIPLTRLSIPLLALIVVLTLSSDVVIDYLTKASEYFFPVPKDVQNFFTDLMAADGLRDIIWKIVLICLMPAVCEEIFVRGFCQTSLISQWGRASGLFGASLIFALLHGNPWHFHLYLILGLLMGWVYLATGSLWASILCHFTNNAWVFLTHVKDFKIPLKPEIGIADISFLAASASVAIASALFLRKLAVRPAPSS